MLLFSCQGLHKEWKLRSMANSEEFKGIGYLSTEERMKRTIVQLYNHYSTTPLFMSVIEHNSYKYVGYPLFLEWIGNCSFKGQ